MMISFGGKSFTQGSVRVFSKFRKFEQVCFMLIMESGDVHLVRPIDKNQDRLEIITHCELLYTITGFFGYEKIIWQGLTFYALKSKEETALIVANDGDEYFLWRRSCTFYKPVDKAFALCNEQTHEKRLISTYSFEKRQFYNYRSGYFGYFCKNHLIIEVEEFVYQIIAIDKYGRQIRLVQEISSPFIKRSLQTAFRFVIMYKNENNCWIELIDPSGNTIVTRNVTWFDKDHNPKSRYLRVSWMHETDGFSYLDLITGFIYDQIPE